ncbi:hypothetical protein [Enterococcus faecalis]|uniref:hypothetical protein n=1 Tax=Enterococcus faecalis TaxID=1351 RepID=UPI003D2C0294
MKSDEIKKEEELERARIRARREEEKNRAGKGCIGCLGFFIILAIIVAIIVNLNGNASDNKDMSTIKYGESNDKVIENVSNLEKSIGWTCAEDQIKKLYKIDNFKINGDKRNLKVIRMPDEENSQTGESYKNVYNISGDYTYHDNIYHYSLLYSLKDDNNYKVLSLYSNIDDTKTINIPLKSDQ